MTETSSTINNDSLTQRENENSTNEQNKTLVQYVAIRSDLKWPKGALIAQCCHASISAIHLNYVDKETVKYLENLDTMHKVVVGVPSEKEMLDLEENLKKNEIKHKLWIEQPENMPTCIATKPYSKYLIENFFKSFKLFK